MQHQIKTAEVIVSEIAIQALLREQIFLVRREAEEPAM